MTKANARGSISADFFTDLAQPPINQNPHQHLHGLRGERLPRLRTGEIVIVGHGDATEILRGNQFVKPPLPMALVRAVRTMNRMFLLLNQPDHQRLRQVTMPWFAPQAVAERRAQIETETRDQLAGRDNLEVISEFAYPLPLRLISTWLGVPKDDEDLISDWGRVIAAAVDQPVPINARQAARFVRASMRGKTHPLATIRAVKGLVRYGSEQIAQGQETTEASFLALLRRAHADAKLDFDEAVATWILMVVAGHETTANLIGNAMHCLLTHPEQLEILRSDPSLLGNAIDETLRFETPVPYTARVATEDNEVPSGRIRKGEMVIVVLGAANRDPEVFVEPDRFDITRDAKPHLGFAHGSHFCIGHQVARMETEIAVGALVDRNPRVTNEPTWRASYGTRGIARLNIELQQHD